MIRLYSILLSVTLSVTLSLLSFGALGAEVVLARRGQPAEYSIVTRTDATTVERFAANELQTFIARQTGVELPIIDSSISFPTPSLYIVKSHSLLTGSVPTTLTGSVPTNQVSSMGSVPTNQAKFIGTVPTNLGSEGFEICVKGCNLSIMASGPRGVLYGVYELLERFGGCAWYTPTFEVVPQLETFAVPEGCKEVQRPAFALRETSVGGLGYCPEYSVRNRLNFAWLKEFGAAEYRYDPCLRKCHTFEELLPAREWFATHPEYFSLVNGKRLGFQTQLCLTNPEVLARCTAKVFERIAVSYPKGIRHYGISPNDWGNWCECAKCAELDQREGSHSGTLIAFVNAIAEKVEAKYPDVIIQTLAYSYTRRAPKHLRPRKNVLICLCTIECDFAKSLVESQAEENIQTRQSFQLWGQSSASERTNVSDTSVHPTVLGTVPRKECGNRLGVWDYTVNFASYLHPWPNFHTLQGNLRFFRSCGVREVYEQGNGGSANDIWSNIKIWLIAKWLWNPDRDANELLTKCFADHFGPAATEIRTVFDKLHSLPRDTKQQPMGCFENIFSSSVPVDVLEEVAPILEQAAGKVKGTAYERRVAQARAPIDFTRAIRGLAMPCVRGDRPLAGGDRPQSNGDRPLAGGDRPLAGGDRPQLNGDRPRLFAEQRAGARRVVELLDSPGSLRLASDLVVNAQLERRLRNFATLGIASQPMMGTVPQPMMGTVPQPTRKVTLEEHELIGFFPTAFKAELDPLAVDGRAVRLPADHDTCLAWFLFNSVVTDPAGIYLVRIRVLVGEKSSNTVGSAPAFRTGLCNLRTNKSYAFSEPKLQTLRQGRYTWYTVGTLTPKRGDALWIDLADAPNHPDVFIDQIQLIEL